VISPELPSYIATMAARHKLTFPILWDEKSKVAEAFGLAFTLPDDLREVYRSFGNDLAVKNGDPSWRLPVPARFVIDAKGIVRAVEADPDYRYRPEPTATLDVLRKVVASASPGGRG
jgi:peroxiredoxin